MTYEEMQTAWTDSQMIRLVESAMLEKSAEMVNETNTTDDRLDWAKSALDNPGTASGGIWRFMLGANSEASLDQVLRSVGDPATPTDPVIKSNVDAAVDAYFPPAP